MLRTKRSSPVNTRTLTRMLVPKPKKAFQSPGTQKRSLRAALVAVVCIASSPVVLRFRLAGLARPGQGFNQRLGVGDPAEDAALGLDHLQAHGLELWKVGSHAVFEHEAVIAPVVGFAHRGVDADFGRYAGDDELLDAAALKDCVEIGGEEGALARLVDHRLAGRRAELRHDVLARRAPPPAPAHRP